MTSRNHISEASRRAALRSRAVLATASAAVLLAPAALQGQTRIGIELGAVPEPLVLESVEGEEIDLAESFGHRPVLLQFWASWCTQCRELTPMMRAAHAEYGEQVDFFGIAVAVGQNPRRVQKHLEKMPLPFPMLWDEGGAATRAFMAPTTSYIVMLDAGGRVVYTGIDADQDVMGGLARAVRSRRSPPREPRTP